MLYVAGSFISLLLSNAPGGLVRLIALLVSVVWSFHSSVDPKAGSITLVVCTVCIILLFAHLQVS